jgi:hypothetical protein
MDPSFEWTVGRTNSIAKYTTATGIYVAIMRKTWTKRYDGFLGFLAMLWIVYDLDENL